MRVAPAFARFAEGLGWTTLPAAVRDAVLDHTLDTLAVACAGAGEAASAALRACHAGVAAHGVCAVVAGPPTARLPPVDAALVNAFAARIHTFDDTLEAGPIHPGSAVIVAALAAASWRDAPLTDALLGAVAGYELAVRLAEALGPAHYDAGFHGTGTLGAPAAALAAARALGLDAEAMAQAIRLGAAAASGTRQYQIDGGMAHSAMNGARAAAAGMQAALHAQAGMTGAAGQLDGRWGMLTLLGGGGGAAVPVATLGTDWGLLRVALKPYPTCRFTHGPVSLLACMAAEQHITADDVAALEIATFAQSASVSDRPDWRDGPDAILSHQFAAAATLLHGPPRLSDLDRLATDNAVRRLAARVSVVVAPEFARRGAADWPHRLRLTLHDGRMLEGFSPAPPGGADAPLGQHALHAKARDLIDGALGPGRFEPLLAALAAPERITARALLALLEAP